jgi:LPXTG-motif cell wall-anchored protein
MDTTKGHFESDPDNVALNYLNRAEFEETPITLPTVIANEGWEFKGWDVWGKEHFVLGADATELGTSGLGAFPVGSLVGGIYLYPIFMEAPKPVEPTPTTPVEPTPTTPVEPTPTTPVEPTPTTPVEPTPTTPVVTPTTPVIPETTPTNTPANTPTEETNTPDNTPTNTPDVTKSNTPADNSSKIIPQTGVSSTNSNSVAGLAIVLVAALGGAAAYLFINRKKLN